MNKLLLYNEGGHSGYIDRKGNVVIPIKYPVARSFCEGLAWVNDDGKWCLINEEGEVVLSCDWSVVGDFHDGLAFVKDASEKIGFIDKTGMNVIPCQWKVVDNFSEGFAAVQDENGNYGYIDKIGQLVIPYQYKDAKPFQNGLTIVQISDNEWTFIDKAGKRPYSIWAEVRAFSEGLAPVKNANGLWGYINEKGEVVLDFQWTDAYSFSEGLAAVSVDDKYGYINKQGEVVIQPQWLVAGEFSEGLAPVSVSMMKMGYINTKGEMIVPDRWTFACSHIDGVAFVADAMTMESGYIDRIGRFFNPSHPLELSADEIEEAFPLDDLEVIEDPQDLSFDNPFYPLPEWAECPEESLNVGCDYVYFVSGEIYYRCHVLFNDGVSAILRITNRYFECFQDILFYQEVKRYFPDFEDPEATDRSEYVCLDIETGQSYFCRFEYEDDIYCYLEEEDGELAPYLIDPADFREWRKSSKKQNN